MTNLSPFQAIKEAKGNYDIAPIVAEFVSDDSLEVLEHFGYEAPTLLNNYSNALEDALIAQIKRVQELEAQLAELTSR